MKLPLIIFFILLPVAHTFAHPSDDQIPVCGSNSCLLHNPADSTSQAVLNASTSSQLNYFLANLFNTSDWPARWNCGSWTSFHGWFYILSDFGIWAAYFAIPVVMAFFIYKRRRRELPFTGIFLLFAAFIFSCGLTHLIDAAMFWYPVYNFSALMRFITAVVSIGTVFALVKVTPEVMKYKSPEQLEQIIDDRTHELRVANEQLRLANDKLEIVNEELTQQYHEKEKARQELNLLIESIPQIAWTTDNKGDLSYVNEQWWNFTGISKDNYVPDWDRVFHPDDLHKVREKWEVSLKEGKEFVAEGRIRSKDNEHVWFLIKGIPVKDQKGNIDKWIGTFTDINDQKVNEQRKDTFLNIASHELKTPLSIISAYTEISQEMITDEEKSKFGAYLSKISVHVNKLNKLIDELLNVSRIDSGKLEMDMQPEELAAVVKECIDDFLDMNPTGHKIIFNKDADATILCDKNKLQQVIFNLLSNASKYSEEGSTIEVNIGHDNQDAICSIRDEGEGIPKEDLNKIFSRFYRVGPDKKVSGLGLGLYISHEIISRHQGLLTVESELAIGSTFTIKLPRS